MITALTFSVCTTPVRLEATRTLSRDFGKTNRTLLASVLSSTEWDTVLEGPDIDQCWHNIR